MKGIKTDMKYLSLLRVILTLALSITLNPPKYCSVHEELDYCYQQVGKDSGNGEVDH